jgi:MYXO-CTERM domain-containing protein
MISLSVARGAFATFAIAIAFGAFGCSAPGEDEAGAASDQAAVGAAPYGAAYVSQSFPLATTAMKMKAGQIIPSYIELKNIGTNTWDSNTKIGTTQPRDRSSAFADSTWLAPNRASAVTGTVAPGGTFKFTFDLKAPSKPGTYDEFFGVVEEGVVWFGDSGQGGPVDTDLEVKIEVSAADPAVDGGAADDDAGEDSGGPISVGEIPVGSDAGDPSDRPPAANADASNGGSSGGCSVSRSSRESRTSGLLLLVALGIAAALRRRRVAVGL